MKQSDLTFDFCDITPAQYDGIHYYLKSLYSFTKKNNLLESLIENITSNDYPSTGHYAGTYIQSDDSFCGFCTMLSYKSLFASNHTVTKDVKAVNTLDGITKVTNTVTKDVKAVNTLDGITKVTNTVTKDVRAVNQLDGITKVTNTVNKDINTVTKDTANTTNKDSNLINIFTYLKGLMIRKGIDIDLEDCTLLINERLPNIPMEIGINLLKFLINDVKDVKDEYRFLSFNYYLYITKVYKQKDKIIFNKNEDRIINRIYYNKFDINDNNKSITLLDGRKVIESKICYIIPNKKLKRLIRVIQRINRWMDR
eukprot:GHVP01021358.1.p1 GENE.GHVP01021358.1~~GHVP01021358.1.p1  ORF type:complete len:311 (+),score=22.33 GHVP01021358.1:267-1199(+)